ncbi:MAG: hypothetical protein ACMXYF_03290 [Candidatus Woesearchaeota archaeon]
MIPILLNQVCEIYQHLPNFPMDASNLEIAQSKKHLEYYSTNPFASQFPFISWPIDGVIIEVLFRDNQRALGLYSGFKSSIDQKSLFEINIKTSNRFADSYHATYNLDRYNLLARDIQFIDVFVPTRSFSNITEFSGLMKYLSSESNQPLPVVIAENHPDYNPVFSNVGYLLDMDEKQIKISHTVNKDGSTDVWHRPNIQGINGIYEFFASRFGGTRVKNWYEEWHRDWIPTEHFDSLHLLKRVNSIPNPLFDPSR